MAKKSPLPVAGIILFALISATAAILMQSTSAQPQQTAQNVQKDTVIVRCSTGDSNFKVTAYQGSTAAPAQRSTNCAEKLAILAREGFTVCNIGHYDDAESEYAVFFLMR